MAASADDVLDVLGTARAVRYFKPDPVPPELVERLVWAATRAPSRRGALPQSLERQR